MIQAIINLRKRIEAIEARQRDRKWHDPQCPIRVAQKINEQGRVYAEATGPCNCWLSE